MVIFEVGRVCVKLAGRDADQKCIVVDIIDDNFVIIDGLTRRKKCNVKHLEPLDEIVKIKKGADHKEVAGVFKKMGIELVEKKSKKTSERPKKVRKAKEKPVVEEKPKPTKKVAEKKTEAVKEETPKEEEKKPVKKAPVKKKAAKKE